MKLNENCVKICVCYDVFTHKDAIIVLIQIIVMQEKVERF